MGRRGEERRGGERKSKSDEDKDETEGEGRVGSTYYCDG
jgi:hypothetical protein